MSEGLSVLDVATEAGVASSTVRLYARRGLLAARRTPGNARRFDYDAPCRVAVIKAAQRCGLDLDAIGGLLRELPDNARPEDWDRLTRQMVAEADRRIAALREVIDQVTVTSPLAAMPLSPAEVRARHDPQPSNSPSALASPGFV